MRYQRTQVYLDPEEHRKLTREARERGISLAALMREIVSIHVGEQAPRYGSAKGWDAIIGIVDEVEPSDIVAGWDDIMDDVADHIYRKKMGRATAPAGRKGRAKRAPR